MLVYLSCSMTRKTQVQTRSLCARHYENAEEKPGKENRGNNT